MNLDEIHPDTRVIFISISKAVVMMKRHHKSQEQFQMLCHEVWETMELNGIDKFEEFITGIAKSGLVDLLKVMGVEPNAN